MWTRCLAWGAGLGVLASLSLAMQVAESREFLPPDPPKYIVVLSRQRSSSSTLSLLLGQHPCSLDGNEIWFASRHQDTLGAFRHTDMTPHQVRQNPGDFLHGVHDPICNEAIESGRIPDSCEGKCTIVVKTFDVHNLAMRGLFSMMEDPDFRFVVLERDVDGEYCSHRVAEATGDFGITPGAHKEGSAEKVECGSPTESFSANHSRWFSAVRDGLRARGTFFIDVPFSLVASCGLQDAFVSILGFMGLYAPFESNGLRDVVDAVFDGC